MTIDPLILQILLGILALFSIVLLVLYIRLDKKMKQFLITVDSKNIAESMTHIKKALSEHEQFETEMREYLRSVEQRVRNSVQHIETVRFNPWSGNGAGGNQSFATAFIDEHGNGVVLSSLYSRDRVSIYAKPVERFVSTFELSDEERLAIEKCQKTIQK